MTIDYKEVKQKGCPIVILVRHATPSLYDFKRLHHPCTKDITPSLYETTLLTILVRNYLLHHPCTKDVTPSSYERRYTILVRKTSHHSLLRKTLHHPIVRIDATPSLYELDVTPFLCYS